MAKKTTGKIYTSGKAKFWYIRFQFEGKETRTRLLDPAGKPITKRREAEAAAERLLAHIHETDKAERLRKLKADLRDAEQAAEEAAAMLANSRAAIANGWTLFMECPKRPASCKRFPADAIPAHTTASNYRGYFKHFREWIYANAPKARLLSDITPENAAQFMEYIRRKGASGTFNKYLQFFNCFFTTLVQAGKMTGDNPFRDIDRTEPEYNSKKPLTVEQIAVLINRAEGDLQMLIALGYFTGLRLGDCCTLQWSEIDLLRRVIERIPRKTAHTVKDKTQATVKIGIPAFLFQMLTAIPPEKRTGYLLPEIAEKYLTGGDQQITKKVLKHFAGCGIEIHRPGTGRQETINPKNGKFQRTGTRAVVEIGFHSLRYSYISHNAEIGTPAAIIQRNAGHSNPAMTEHYTKISDRAAVQYAEAMCLPLDAGLPTSTQRVLPESEEQVARSELRRLIEILPETAVQTLLNQAKEMLR